jgi:hypothetical protein
MTLVTLSKVTSQFDPSRKRLLIRILITPARRSVGAGNHSRETTMEQLPKRPARQERKQRTRSLVFPKVPAGIFVPVMPGPPAKYLGTLLRCDLERFRFCELCQTWVDQLDIEEAFQHLEPDHEAFTRS